MTKKNIYLPGLNGLRAIAAISVLLGHITSFTFTNNNFLLPPFTLGEHGVTLFFVISGFLITYLLLNEKTTTSDISIGKFYIRRILRIWPIYYLFIVVCFTLSFFIPEINNIQQFRILFYLFFAANFATIFDYTVRIIIHFWSIGVEEQFYIFWPWIVRKKNNRLIFYTMFIIVLLITLKLGAWYLYGNKSIIYKFISVSRFQCMLIGAIGASLYFNKNRSYLALFSHKALNLIISIVFCLIFCNLIPLPAPIAAEVVAIFSLFIITIQVTESAGAISLENRLFDFVGKISYGIYVLHPLVILLYSILYRKLNLTFYCQVAIVYSSILITTILIAYLSYNFYEKPFLDLKERFAVVKSKVSKY